MAAEFKRVKLVLHTIKEIIFEFTANEGLRNLKKESLNNHFLAHTLKLKNETPNFCVLYDSCLK